jgi:Tfp pilus assembly protein PilX
MRPTSELLVEADALLRDAELKVQKLGNTLSSESYNMAQGCWNSE